MRSAIPGAQYGRGSMHANSAEGFNAEGFNDRVRRTIAGVFHHISPDHADLYSGEIGFRWAQRTVAGQAERRTRKGRRVIQILWSRAPPALQRSAVFRYAVGRQLQRTKDSGISIRSAVAVFG